MTEQLVIPEHQIVSNRHDLAENFFRRFGYALYSSPRLLDIFFIPVCSLKRRHDYQDLLLLPVSCCSSLRH